MQCSIQPSVLFIPTLKASIKLNVDYMQDSGILPFQLFMWRLNAEFE